MAGLAGCGSGGRPHPSQPHPSPAHLTAVAPWRTYRTDGVSVAHPAPWLISEAGRPNPGGFGEPVATLGTLTVDATCRPITGGATECGPQPSRRLHAGDVVTAWTWDYNPGSVVASAKGPVRTKGTRTTVDGHPAWVLVTRGGTIAGECKVTLGSTSGATRQIDVAIPLHGQVLDMSACLGGSPAQLAQLQADVLHSVHSARFTD